MRLVIKKTTVVLSTTMVLAAQMALAQGAATSSSSTTAAPAATSSTATSAAASTSNGALVAPAAAAATSTATAESATPAPAKKVSGSFALAGSMAKSDLDSKGASNSPLTTFNILAVGFKANDTESYGVAAQFEANYVPLVEDRENTANGFKMQDPYISYTKKYGKKVLGSDAPLAISYRYYVPATVANYADQYTKRGTIRMIGEIPWNLNTKLTVSWVFDPRLVLRSGEQTLDIRNYANLYYNVTDKFSPYLTAGMFTRFGEKSKPGSLLALQKITGAAGEQGYMEAGVSYTINDQVGVMFSHASVFGMNVGPVVPFAADNSEYDVSLTMAF